MQQSTQAYIVNEAGYVWKETANERKILILGKGGGRLIERDMSTGSYKENVIIPEIPLTDNDTIDKYELTNVRN